MTTHHDQKVLLSSTLAKAFHGITIDDQNFLLNFHGLFSQERTIQQHFVLSFSDSPTHQELSLLTAPPRQDENYRKFSHETFGSYFPSTRAIL
jgi:hypothetical protein